MRIRLYPFEICMFFFASGHFHLLVRVEDSERLARFMGYFNSKLAHEVDRVAVNLAPLPWWRDLSAEQYRRRIGELIEAIIAQAAARRAATGIEPLGPAAILTQHPFSQPVKSKKSPAPLVHAASKRVRAEIRIACAWFAEAFREAAEYLRAGDRLARFPLGSLPPGLPFVRAGRLAIRPALSSFAARVSVQSDLRLAPISAAPAPSAHLISAVSGLVSYNLEI